MCAARHQVMWGTDVCKTCECFVCVCCGCCSLSFLPDAIRGKPNLSREAQQAGAHDCWHTTGGVSCLEWGRGGCPVLPRASSVPGFCSRGSLQSAESAKCSPRDCTACSQVQRQVRGSVSVPAGVSHPKAKGPGRTLQVIAQ